jgi:hypothetical protein
MQIHLHEVNILQIHNARPELLKKISQLLNVISCTFYVTSFGRIKQIHHVRS